MKKFIGIDVSNRTLDVCILNNQNHQTFVIKNNKRDISKFFKTKLKPGAEYHICFENTGKYSWLLMELLPEFGYPFYVVNPIHLKRSLGLTRGKNDQIDGIRIAKFIKKNHEELQAYIPMRKQVQQLKILLSDRKSRIEMKKRLQVKNKENQLGGVKAFSKEMIKFNNRLIKEIDKQIELLEAKIRSIINQDVYLSKLQKIIKSVPGVGDILTWHIIVKTNEFKSIKTARKLACYAGVAPFEHTSGTSVFGKHRVSFYADKQLKSLLHMSALRAVTLDSDFKLYYTRKIEEGKNKMSVINAVRNKIIHVIYALVKNETYHQNQLTTSQQN